MKHFKIDEQIKMPQYFIMGGRGGGRTFYQLLNKARNKLIVAKYEDAYFNESNYVWLIGERESIPPNIDGAKLFGINLCLFPVRVLDYLRR